MKLSPLKTPFQLSLGARGEMVAWGHLTRNGYKILEKNYRCKIGEVDIIATKDGRLRFIEVKTRTTEAFGRPEESVGSQKQHKLALLAEFYLKAKKLNDVPVSFEVVSILYPATGEPQIRIIENAFDLNYGELR